MDLKRVNIKFSFKYTKKVPKELMKCSNECMAIIWLPVLSDMGDLKAEIGQLKISNFQDVFRFQKQDENMPEVTTM